MPKKCILIILDGIGDRSFKSFNNQTPLQAAWTPVLDQISKVSANGLFHAGILGQALPSENAHFSIFGYDMTDFPGRGCLEAIGHGLPVTGNDVSVLAHLVCATFKEHYLILDDGKPQIDQKEATCLFDAIREYRHNQITIRLNPTKGYRAIVTLSGDVCPYITDSDPMLHGRFLNDVVPVASHVDDKNAQITASALKAYLLWCHSQLESHPVNQKRIRSQKPLFNALVTQRAGQVRECVPFYEKCGLKGASVSSGAIYAGIAKYLGLDHFSCKDSGDPGKDISERMKKAYGLLPEYDFIHIHTKTPDEAAHTKNPVFKRDVIESLDKGIGAAVKPFLENEDVILIITADHSTPSCGDLIHSGEAVPIMIHGHGVRRDEICLFDETVAGKGALGQIYGKELMYLVLNYLDRIKLTGIMDSPMDHPYFPADTIPLNFDKVL